MARKAIGLRRMFCAVALTGLFSSAYALLDTTSQHYYLYTYFYNTEQEAGPRIAVSSNGINWVKVDNEQPLFTPTAGIDKLARDPSMWFDAKTGLFHCVWTSGWTETGIGYATSKDLKTWSDQVQLPLGRKIPGCLCCWSPEIFYDDLKDSVMIYWSTDYGTNGKSSFCVMTKDFVTFSDPVKFFDPGYSQIDASIVKYTEGKYYLFFKDERTAMEAAKPSKNIHYVYGSTPQGPWSDVSSPVTGIGCEGASPIIIGDELRVYFDTYNNPSSTKRMVKVTADPSVITPSPWPEGDVMTASGAPFLPGHGSIMEIKREYALSLVYGTPLPPFIAASQSAVNHRVQPFVIARKGTVGICDLLGRNAACFRNVNNAAFSGGRIGQRAPGVLLVKPANNNAPQSILTVR